MSLHYNNVLLLLYQEMVCCLSIQWTKLDYTCFLCNNFMSFNTSPNLHFKLLLLSNNFNGHHHQTAPSKSTTSPPTPTPPPPPSQATRDPSTNSPGLIPNTPPASPPPASMARSSSIVNHVRANGYWSRHSRAYTTVVSTVFNLLPWNTGWCVPLPQRMGG